MSNNKFVWSSPSDIVWLTEKDKKLAEQHQLARFKDKAQQIKDKAQQIKDKAQGGNSTT